MRRWRVLEAFRESHARSERPDDQLSARVASLANRKLQRSASRLDEKVIGRLMPPDAAKNALHSRSERLLDQVGAASPAGLKLQRLSTARLDVTALGIAKLRCSSGVGGDRVPDVPVDVDSKSWRPNRTVPVTSPRHCQ